MKETMEISPAMEDYLETIFLICAKDGAARVSDIARYLDIAAPSVTEVIHKLVKSGLVNQEKYGPVTLTDKGRRYASKILQKHKIIKSFLEDVLGVDPETAEEDACRVEHAVSAITIERLIDFMAGVKKY